MNHTMLSLMTCSLSITILSSEGSAGSTPIHLEYLLVMLRIYHIVRYTSIYLEEHQISIKIDVTICNRNEQ